MRGGDNGSPDAGGDDAGIPPGNGDGSSGGGDSGVPSDGPAQTDSEPADSPAGDGAVPLAKVCGNAAILAGPSTAPAGAYMVPAGDNSSLTPNYANPGFSVPKTTFWFAPGVHTLGTGQFAQIDPGDGDVYLGAPGAIISGQGMNATAFGGTAANVTIEYLTIQDFVSNEGQMVVNHDGGQNWIIKYNTVQNNKGGAGVGLGTNSVTSQNCLTNNGEYGFSSICESNCDPLTGGPTNLTLTDNEISLNDSDGEYDQTGGIQCGCSGGGKLWQVNGATLTANYVHDNGSPGIWADTDNANIVIADNTIENNYAEGIIIEVSYNFSITGNVLTHNAWKAGPMLGGFPDAAIYISESGGDLRIPGAYSGKAIISGNTLTDNWGGIVVWENADRFCSDGSDGPCTLVDPKTFTVASCAANLPTAVAGKNTGSPAADYYDGCRWKSQNVEISGNTFHFNPAHIPQCTVANLCGFMGIFSNYGSFAPYDSSAVCTAITFDQNNTWKNNTYDGPWNFWAWAQSNIDNPVPVSAWRGAVTDQCATASEKQSGTCDSGFGQDQGSTGL